MDLNQAKQQIKQLEEEIEQKQKEVTEFRKQKFNELSKQLFEENPELESFGWRQCTPFYADGETPQFSANTNDPDINGVSGYDIWGDEYKNLKPMQDKVEKFLELFNDDMCLAMFGDHVQVTVFRDRIEISEYANHD